MQYITENPALFAAIGAGLLVLVVLVWLASRPLPPVGRWLARGLVVLALAVPALLYVLVPSGWLAIDGRPAQYAERKADDKTGGRSSAPSDTASKDNTATRSAERTVRSPVGPTSPTLSRPQGYQAPPQPRPPESPQAPTSEPDAPATRGLTPPQGAGENGSDKWDVVPVFYGTDRSRAKEEPQRIVYGTERAKRLELGRALVTIPKIHEVPEIERPWVYRLPFTRVVIYEEKEDPAKHFTLRRVQAMTRQQFLALIRERLRTSARFKDHAVVFVHGFNTSFDFALYRAAQLTYDLKFDGAPFVYSWPSQGSISSYSYDRESAGQAEPYLEDFLKLVVNETGAKAVSIIAHSMGNQLLMPVLQNLRPQMPDGVQLSQIILAAPDVDRDRFANLAQRIKGISRGITLYAHANDRALDISKQFWGGIPRAGDIPDEGPVIIQGVDTIDITQTSTQIFDLHHSGYAENKTLLNDIQLLIQTGERPPEKRIPILERVTTPRGDYWRYPPK